MSEKPDPQAPRQLAAEAAASIKTADDRQARRASALRDNLRRRKAAARAAADGAP